MKQALVAFLLFGSTTFAQTVTKQPFSVWTTAHSQCRIGEKWAVSMEVHERMADFFQTQGSLVLRPSVDYFFHKNVMGTVGYTFVSNRWVGGDHPFILENNLWEQVLLTQRFERSKLQHRLREEHRWIESKTTGENDFRNRFRYRLIYTHGLKTLKNNDGLFVQVFNEVWFSQGTGVLPKNFHRNWFYIGLGYAFSDDMNLQTGFMHQYDRISEGVFAARPIWQSTFTWNF